MLFLGIVRIIQCTFKFEYRLVIRGVPLPYKHPRWLEGPHVYKVNGMYYLMAAEGGTQSGHKEVIFRSEKVKGPYLPYKNNPILTQLGLPADRINKVTASKTAYPRRFAGLF